MTDPGFPDAFAEVAAAQSIDELVAVERRWLGRNGVVTLALKHHAKREKQAREIEAVMDRIERACVEKERQIA